MPSLKPHMADQWGEIYRDAVDRAVAETQLEESAFPAECPYSMERVLAAEQLGG